jgi:hypothetical protein
MSVRDFLDRAIRSQLRQPDNLRELLAEVVPGLGDRFVCEEAEPVDREFLLEDWRGRESDLFFRIPFRTADSLFPVFVCILLEHQSKPDPRMPLRVLVYAVLYWEREWKAWEDRHAANEPLRLTPILPIVFHTGLEPWKSNRTLAELLESPEEMRAYVPAWDVVYWDLANRSPQQLLDAAGAWFKALTALRAAGANAEAYRALFVEAARRLEALAERQPMRWRDLLNFFLAVGMHRRPKEEHADLFAAAAASQQNVRRREEIKAMSETLQRSWGEEVFATGEAAGKLQGLREALQQVLEGRFGTLPENLLRQIEAAADMNRLLACIRQGGRINSLEELQL